MRQVLLRGQLRDRSCNINGYNLVCMGVANVHGWLGRSSASSIHSRNASYSSCMVGLGWKFSRGLISRFSQSTIVHKIRDKTCYCYYSMGPIILLIECATVTMGLVIERATVTMGLVIERATVTMGLVIERATVTMGLVIERATVTMGLVIERATVTMGLVIERATVTMGLVIERATVTMGLVIERATVTMGPVIERATVTMGPVIERATVTMGPTTNRTGGNVCSHLLTGRSVRTQSPRTVSSVSLQAVGPLVCPPMVGTPLHLSSHLAQCSCLQLHWTQGQPLS